MLSLAAPLLARCRALQLETQHARLDWIPQARETVVLAFVRSLRLGAMLTDGSQLVTPTMPPRFDEIADGIKDLYFTRVDVGFERLDERRRGEIFQIVEVNGVGPRGPPHQGRQQPVAQYKLAFHIGHLNRQRGCQPVGARAVAFFHQAAAGAEATARAGLLR